ncbi:DUF1634 domain-containing protein [Paraburkholderia susongensis]|uniref:DUF1634 domain-containing protein n=1 Tax=Paraburkholderia susongensis TaxID=1515439 RepID=A0A1X7LVT3_9BURK|nr:DUF1634 domain-containing protein [Paraburkholderia susongensis]SMG57810.1 Protein of unknown function [Paraburkholderia susongensis]
MNRAARVGMRFEHWLANLLHYGTWIASGTIAAGLGLALVLPAVRTGSGGASGGPATLAGMPIVSAGIALFILLPVMRLILMLGVFLHRRDYRFSAIAALVLAIVAAGLLVGAA